MSAESLRLLPPLERVRAALRAWPPSPPQIGVILAIAAVYFAAGRAGLVFAMAGGQVTPVWPSTGLALAALMIFGRGVWPGVWLGSFALNAWSLLHARAPLPLAPALGVAAGIATGAALTAWLGAWLVRRVAGPGQPLDHLRGVFALLGLGGVASGLLSATNGTLWLAVSGNVAWVKFVRVWLTWWVGDAAGVFLFAPLLLAWCVRASLPLPRRLIETILCLALLTWVSANVFIGDTWLTFPAKSFSFILIPLLVWPALRLGQRAATTTALLIGAVAVWGTIHRWGPFPRSSPIDSLVALEWFLSVMTLTALCVAAQAAQQHRAESERRRTLDELETRVRERTADLTAANAALEHSEAYHASILESALDCIITIDHEGRIVDFNPAAERTFGHTRAAVLGRPLAETIIPPALRDAHRAGLARLAATGESRMLNQRFEFTALRADGAEFPVDLAITRLPGEPARFAGFMRDITERRQLEEQFRQSQKMEAIGQLAGGLAHDFNNLLTVILGNVALVEMNKGRPAEETELIQEIGLAAERAANLTRQMLTFSRRQVMQARPVDLNATVAEMARMLRRTLGEEVILQLESSAGLPAVQADAGMMEQMLMNLAINARDAMPGGGRLTIRTGVEDVSEEDARQMPDASAGRFVCVAVSDTGRGIAPEHLPRIFEPFFTTKEAGKGTGLGLATVYGIVRQHHGWLRVASTAGCGTTFEVFLRALDAAAEATGHRRDLEQSPGGTETILLVEDDYSVRQIGRTVLERLGYRVIEALSGAAALQAWAEAGGAVDLLLTDLVMPGGMGGRELAAQLRVKKPALEVIYCSGYSAEFMGRDFVLEEGVNFLQKPYEFHHLARIVRARLDGRAKETG